MLKLCCCFFLKDCEKLAKSWRKFAELFRSERCKDVILSARASVSSSTPDVSRCTHIFRDRACWTVATCYCYYSVVVLWFQTSAIPLPSPRSWFPQFPRFSLSRFSVGFWVSLFAIWYSYDCKYLYLAVWIFQWGPRGGFPGFFPLRLQRRKGMQIL